MNDQPEWTWRHASELQDHWWWRPGWHEGTRYYAFHLAVGESPALADLAAKYQHAIRGIEGLDPIPREWLHVTMQGVGFAGDVSDSQRSAVMESVQEVLTKLAPFTIRFARPVIRPEALVLAPDPVEPMLNLRSLVRKAVGDALGDGRGDLGTVDYQPHASFAYVSADQPAAEIRAKLDAAHLEPAELVVDSVPLIEMHRDNRMYEWRTIQSLALGSTVQSATAPV